MALGGDGSLDAFVANDGASRVWLNQASIPTSGADVSVMLPSTRYFEGSGTSCGVGATARFDVTVHNAGPQTATNVTVHTASGSFSWPATGPTHNFGALLPGESATASLAGVPGRDSPTGTIYCVAAASVRVSADQADADMSNNTSQSEVVAYSCRDLCALEAIFCLYSPPTLRPLSPLQSLQEAVIDLLVYYHVRDGVLAATPAGRHYIFLYEAHGAEIRGLLDSDPALEAEAVATLQLWEPNLWALVRGGGGDSDDYCRAGSRGRSFPQPPVRRRQCRPAADDRRRAGPPDARPSGRYEHGRGARRCRWPRPVHTNCRSSLTRAGGIRDSPEISYPPAMAPVRRAVPRGLQAGSSLSPVSGHLFANSGHRLGNLASGTVALGDLNSGGRLEAFVANAGSPNEVWHNDGGWQFTVLFWDRASFHTSRGLRRWIREYNQRAKRPG